MGESDRSEMQLLDIADLMRQGYDEAYIDEWKERLGVSDLFQECLESIHQNNAE